MSTTPLPRLLVLTSTYPRWVGDHEPGFVHELARRLARHFDVSVLAPHAPGSMDEERIDGVDVHRFRYAPEKLERLAYQGGIPANLTRRPWLALLVPWFLTAQFVAALRLARRLRPDVVHAHWLLPSGLVGALLRELPGSRFRLVVTAHGADVHVTGGILGRLLKREVLDSADTVTVVSNALGDVLTAQMPSLRVSIAPMGVDLRERFTPAASRPTAPVLVFAGRLVEKKGVADLLRAMPAIIAAVPEAQLRLAGDGPLADQLRQLATELGIDGAVSFLGSVPNDALPDLFRQARLVVLPFRVAADGDQEGLGLVTIEALGCGIPVIASDLPAVRDVIEDGIGGRLVPPGDPQRLAETAIELLGDDSEAEKLALSGRDAVVGRYDWETVTKRYVELLTESGSTKP